MQRTNLCNLGLTNEDMVLEGDAWTGQEQKQDDCKQEDFHDEENEQDMDKTFTDEEDKDSEMCDD